MKTKNLFLLIFFFTISSSIYGQRWRLSRSEITFGVGTNNFMGDLGGGSKDAAHFFGLRDLDMKTTRPVAQVGYRYRIAEAFSMQTNITYARLSADDANSASLGRQLRNLSFVSNIWEGGLHFEYFVKKDKENPRYSFSSLSKFRNLSIYVFTGIGAFYYNPKAEKDGILHELRPLHTEGQTYSYEIEIDGEAVTINNPDEYKPIAFDIPLGVGAKYNLTRQWAITGELSVRYTTTDYMDDASDSYFNYTEAWLNNYLGDVTPDDFYTDYQLNRYFSDKHIQLANPEDPSSMITQNSEEWDDSYYYKTGKKYRGSPDFNDAYVLFIIKMSYRIPAMGRARPKF